MIPKTPRLNGKAAETQTGSLACGGLLLGPNKGRASALASCEAHRGCGAGHRHSLFVGGGRGAEGRAQGGRGAELERVECAEA